MPYFIVKVEKQHNYLFPDDKDFIESILVEGKTIQNCVDIIGNYYKDELFEIIEITKTDISNILTT